VPLCAGECGRCYAVENVQPTLDLDGGFSALGVLVSESVIASKLLVPVGRVS
jgi:hypothetical protein